jgi:hypothetical protein
MCCSEMFQNIFGMGLSMRQSSIGMKTFRCDLTLNRIEPVVRSPRRALYRQVRNLILARSVTTNLACQSKTPRNTTAAQCSNWVPSELLKVCVCRLHSFKVN